MHFSLPFLLLVTSVTAWRDKCESFNLDATPFVRTGAATVAAELEYVSLVASTYYENTARVNLTSGGGSIDSNNLVGFCREFLAMVSMLNAIAPTLIYSIHLYAGLELSLATNKTSGNSAVTEVWLPDDWNGRILGTGNGGWNGGSGLCEIQLITCVLLTAISSQSCTTFLRSMESAEVSLHFLPTPVRRVDVQDLIQEATLT